MSLDSISEPKNYDAADVFDRVSTGNTVAVETDGTAGKQSFTGTVVDVKRDGLLGDADAIYIEVEDGSGFWTIHAERSSSDQSYGPLYADGASAGQRVETIEVHT